MASDILSKCCSKCKQTKRLSDFPITKRRWRSGSCKTCLNAQARKYAQTPRGRDTHLRSVKRWHESEKGKASAKKYLSSLNGRAMRMKLAKAWKRSQKGREYVREYTRKTQFLFRYGIAIEEYDQMLAEQSSLCKICGKPESARGRHGKTKRLSVDHDHDTGNIRGLLCGSCNLLIGFAGDSIERLEAAIIYLREYR